MSQSYYDVVIVGAGPAGIFAALELSQEGGLSIAIVDKGPDIDKRRCLAREPGGRCGHCQPCRLLAGWGGAGAFSDGKLTLSPDVGGHLVDIIGYDETDELIQQVDQTFVGFGAGGPVHGTDKDEIERLQKRASLAGLRLISAPVRHLGTERSGDVLRAMRDELIRRGVSVSTGTKVIRILVEDSQSVGVETADGDVIKSRYVIVAPGREGATWLSEIAHTLRLSLCRNPVDVGVRVELPAEVLAPLTDLVYEPKLIYYSRAFDDKVRTFCLTPEQMILYKSPEGEIGLKPIAEYKKGESILTFDFEQREYKFVQPKQHTVRDYKGTVYRIEVKGKGSITVTGDHLFFVKQGEGYSIQRADELAVGDKLPIAKSFLSQSYDDPIEDINLVKELRRAPAYLTSNLYVRGTEALLRKLAQEHNVPVNRILGKKNASPKVIPFQRFCQVVEEYGLAVDDLQGLELGYMGSRSSVPLLLPVGEGLAKLWGYFIAEGNYNVQPEKMRWFVAFTASDDDVREEIITLFHRIFCNSKHYIVNKQDKHRGTQVFFTNKLACVLFEKVFGIGRGAPNKCLPSCAFELPEEIKYALLSGLFSGDGTISVDGTVAYSTSSPHLAQELTYLLHSLDIPVRYKVQSKEAGAHFGPYEANWDLWQIRVRGIKAKQRLLQHLKLTKKQHRDKKDLILAKDDTYSGLVQTPHHITELDQAKVMHLAITGITATEYEGRVYDFVVPGTHNFVAGDLPFTIHNCVCPYGEVVTEYTDNVMTVNGHSYANRRTTNTNFALLVSKSFTEPFKEPISYGKYIARLANLLSGSVIVQRLGDLDQGRRSTVERLGRSVVTPTLREATPGDLGLVLPYRYIVSLLEMLEAMDQLAPGVYSRHTLLYGVEVKFYSSRLQLSNSLETEVRNLFAAGDGAGVTRGLVQASGSGLVAARAILSRV